MPAAISSTFVIDVTEALNNSSVTVTNPGRSFRISGCRVTGANTASITVHKNTVGGAVACGPGPAIATGDVIDFPATVVLADSNFLATDNIFIIETATAAVTRVQLFCVATGGGQALTVT